MAAAATAASRWTFSGDDPVTGLSFSDLAARSRAMHKTQGFDNFRGFGGGAARARNPFNCWPANPPPTILWTALTPRGTAFRAARDRQLADVLIAEFNPQDPRRQRAGFVEIARLVAALPQKDSVVAEKSAQLDRILQSCLGLEVHTTIAQSEVVPGETMKLHHAVRVHSKFRFAGSRCVIPASGNSSNAR